MQDELDIVDELEAGPGNRTSPMLKVLCILTWVYSFFSCFLFILFFFSSKNLETIFSDVHWSSSFWVFIRFFGAPLVCSVGAILMWNKNKWGYILYMIAELTPVLHAFYITIFVLQVKGPGVFFTVILNIIPIVFAVLYSLQLPYLKPLKLKKDGSI